MRSGSGALAFTVYTTQGAQPWDSHDGDAAKSAAIATNAIASAS